MPRKPNKRHSVIQPLDESYRYIPLTQGQTAIVDAEDFQWLSQWAWHAVWNPYTESFYAYRKVRNESIAMHRVILKCPQEKQGDHKNHDTLDNRRENLREATRFQNACNAPMRSANRSGYKGVCKHTKTLWRSRITVEKKKIHIGFFRNPEDAARAYDVAAQKYHGEFAYQNFP